MCHFVEHSDGREFAHREADGDGADDEVEFEDDYEEAEDVDIVADGGE